MCAKKGENNASYSFRIYDEAGITIAETAGGPKYSEELFHYEELLRLVEDPENDDSILVRPGTIYCDEAGFYYVLDFSDNRIAVFNSAGNYVRSFGQKGQGPGEFTQITATLIWSDIINIFDSSLNRATRYQTDGTLLDVTTVPPSILRAQDMHLLEDGTMLLHHWVTSEDDDAQFMQRRLLSLSPERDTLWVVETSVVQTMLKTRISSGMPLAFGYPFAGSPELIYHPAHGILVSNGIEPELHEYDITGRLIRKIRLELDPVPFTAEDMAKVKAPYEEQLQNSREQGQSRIIELNEALIQAVKFPNFHPVWRDMIQSDEGYLWLRVVEHSADRDARGGGYLFRVLSPEGEYLGESRMPYGPNFTLSGDRLLTVWYPPDAEDYQLLVCRIVPAVSGLEYPN
jgi:hypothetical protein